MSMVARRSASVALPSGLVGGVILGTWTAALNEIEPFSRDGLALTAILMLASAASLTVLVAAASLLLRPLLRWSHLLSGEAAGPALEVGVLAAMASILVLRYRAAGQWSVLQLAVGVALGSALAVYSARARRGGAAPRSIVTTGTLVAMAGAAFLGQTLGSPPPHSAIARPVIADDSVQGSDPRRPAHRLLLLGLDCLDPKALARLLERGELPHFAALRARAASGRLETLQPTYSPAIWTTVATGKSPEEHGISVFTSFAVSGLHRARPIHRLPPYFGVGQLVRLGERWGAVRQVPVTSTVRRSVSLWEMLSRSGRRVALVNWWATWPAETVSGVVVTERLTYSLPANGLPPREAYGLTYPPSLLPDVRKLVLSPQNVPADEVKRFLDDRVGVPSSVPDALKLEDDLRFLIAADQSYLRVFKALLSSGSRLSSGRPYDFAALYLRGIDLVSHRFARFSTLLATSQDAGPETARYRTTLEQYYREADRQLGQVLELTGADTNVIVCSDHGFERQPDGRYGHELGPPGTLLMAGPDVLPGLPLARAHVLDLAPTILYLLGEPVPDDMGGRVLTEALRPELMREFPVRRTGHQERGRVAVVEPSAVDETIKEELRSLGYIR
jgi:type I phosphodiesterase/nucleotide pyrophosphatase